MAHKTQMAISLDRFMKEQMAVENERREHTRLVQKMSHDEGMSMLERGYATKEEDSTERDVAFRESQSYRNNDHR